MKSKTTIIKRAIVIAGFLLLPLTAAARKPIQVWVPVENPPKTLASKPPTAQDFNALFRGFLGTEAVDVSKDDVTPELTKFFSNKTSNGLYGRLKIKEPPYEGTIVVSPERINGQQIVMVAVRMAYANKHSSVKTLHVEYIQIVFSKTGKFVEVRNGVPTTQDF
ncbi:MAG TPA: hypothetical protein VGM73_04825 [Candidatus Didemnitutus sp.]